MASSFVEECGERPCYDSPWGLCDGHEFEQALGDGDGQEILAWYSPWGGRESDRTDQQKQSSAPGLV